MKPKLLILALGGAGLLIVGSVGALVWLNSNRTLQELMPAGTELIPQSAVMTVSVSTDPAQWQRLRQLGTRQTQQMIADKLQAWQTQFFSDRGLDYSKDIQPWIGQQATLALIPISAATASEAKQSLQMWVLPIANLAAAQTVLSRLGSTSLANRTYKGVTIQQTGPQAAHPYAVTVVSNKFVLITSGPKLMEQAIDTQQGQPSLAQIARYPQALSQIEAGQPFAQIYLNLPTAIAQTTLTPTGASPLPSPSQALEYQGLVANFNLESQAIRMSSALWLNPISPGQLAQASGGEKIAQRLPSDSLSMFAIGNFQQVWQNYLQGSNLPYSDLPRRLRDQFNTSTGLDFDREFAPWMTGEFGVALLPTKGKGVQNTGMIILAQANDQTRAEKSLAKLDQIASDRLRYIVSKEKTDNGTLVTWKVPPTIPLASRGWLANKTAFFTFGGSITDQFVPKPKASLANASPFQTVTRSSLSAISSQFFFNLPGTFAQLARNPILPKPGSNLRKTTQGVTGIGITASSPTNWSSRYDIRLQFESAQ
ncbi:MAG: DUF3352 domain-containing protein [Aphanocapsa sp. GSE-SYN-MK-11-07L]|nr:DUF3352 domain-containing protein [Aphanocapsa sp. GSE-SYN-MK-11-07L]